MKTYIIYQNYDHRLIIGEVHLEDDVPDEVISECVLGPEIRVAANGDILETMGFGMFPRVNTDIRPR
jgi:hypothetical protein